MPPVRELCALVAGDFCATPKIGASEADHEAWRAEQLGAECCDRVVVALWPEVQQLADVADLGADRWAERCDDVLLLWSVVLGAASRRCADSGSLVSVIESPAPRDSAGWSPEFALAEGVIALTRAVAQAEGERGVRANVVTTPFRMGETATALPGPPLRSFPGNLQSEVSGAVWLLLGEEAVGVTASVIAADCGRARR